MFRDNLCLLASSLIVFPAGWAGAAGPVKAGTLYFPNKVGDKLVYESTTSEVRSERTAEVTAVEVKEGVALVTTRNSGAVGEWEETSQQHEVSGRGVFVVRSGKKPVDPPNCLLRLPPKVGDAWERQLPGGSSAKFEYSVIGEEEIEVPAGKFHTVRVDSTITIDDSVARTSTWFAVDRGPVKYVLKTSGQEFNVVLKSFTPGK